MSLYSLYNVISYLATDFAYLVTSVTCAGLTIYFNNSFNAYCYKKINCLDKF